MGVTGFSLDIIKPFLKSGITMLELGCQNLYDNDHYGQIANPYWESLDISAHSIDLLGCQGSEEFDLDIDHSKRWDKEQYDLVTDFGTSEHCGDYYHTWLNKWNACVIGGYIVSENPRTGSWPGHGNHYATTDFYKELTSILGCEMLVNGVHPAMGNTTDGWNVYSIIRKNKTKFPTRAVFEKLSYKKS